MKPATALLPLLLLPACALVDQDTFAPTPEASPQSAATQVPSGPPVDPRTPLVTIDEGTPAPNYQEPLRYAVRAAEARDRRVQYDVVAIGPTLEKAAEAQALAEEVMRAILAQRVPANRVHLGMQADPTVAEAQVRIYVR
ncbi:MAG: hypothetical protein AB7F35_23535 [Acetobacteraceae bacterium]